MAAGVKRIAVGGDPWVLAAVGKTVFVGHHNDGYVSRIDARTGKPLSGKTKFNVTQPSVLSLASAGGKVWAGLQTYAHGGNDIIGSVAPIDPRTGKIAGSIIRTRNSADVLAVGGGNAYVATFDRVERVSLSGGSDSTTKVPGNVKGLAYAGGSLWVTTYDAQQDTGQVLELDGKTLDKNGTVPPGEAPQAIAAVRGAVWFTNGTADSGEAQRVDPKNASPGPSVDAGPAPSALANGPAGFWVLDYYTSTVRRIDPTAAKVTTVLKFAPDASSDRLVGTSPRGLAVTKGAVWVSDRDDGVYRIPTAGA
jgi:hypothetical protein